MEIQSKKLTNQMISEIHQIADSSDSKKLVLTRQNGNMVTWLHDSKRACTL